MLQLLPEWARSETFLGVMVALSLATVALGVVAIPAALVRLPDDYLVRAGAGPFASAHPIAAPAVFVLRNVVALALVLAGVAMLLLPGQGLLTLVAALIVSDFPGKRALERRVLGHPGALRAINALRIRARRAPLQAPVGTRTDT
jgi:hypothetical protein